MRVAPHEVGGDFYDIFPIGRKRVGLAVGHAFAREHSAGLIDGHNIAPCNRLSEGFLGAKVFGTIHG